MNNVTGPVMQSVPFHNRILLRGAAAYGLSNDLGFFAQQSAQKDWYNTTMVTGAKAKPYWKQVFPTQHELIFQNDPVHIFEEVNVSFPIRLFGQELRQVVVRPLKHHLSIIVCFKKWFSLYIFTADSGGS